MTVKYFINHLSSLTFSLFPIKVCILHTLHNFFKTITTKIHLVISHKYTLLLLWVTWAANSYWSVLFLQVLVLDGKYPLKTGRQRWQPNYNYRTHRCGCDNYWLLCFAYSCDILVWFGSHVAHVLTCLDIVKNYRTDPSAHYNWLYLLNVLQTSNTHIFLYTYASNYLKGLFGLSRYFNFIINCATDKNVNTWVILGRY